MNSATISADIISYTTLAEQDKRLIKSKAKHFLREMGNKYESDFFFGRIVQGDYIECAIQSPNKILRIALLLKTYIKSIALLHTDKEDKRIKYFKEYAVRLAVAVAPLDIIDSEKGIIDGEAIYLSGRGVKKYTTSGKQKVVIKNTLFFYSKNEEETDKFTVVFSLLDNLIAKCSAKQCEVIFHKLMGLSEKEKTYL